MRANNTGRANAARAFASGLACFATAVLVCTPARAQTEGPIDAYAAAEDMVPAVGDVASLTLDSFALGTEYAPFPPAEVPFDIWAAPGDKPLLLSLEPEDEAGTYDALALPGDELERYRRASAFGGGYGPGEKRCVILMYHRFRAFPANKFEVSYADFRAQLDYIAGNGYEVIPIDQLVEALQTQDPDLLPPRSVVITVDDGFRCVYDFAWPLLGKYEFPFAVYIYTDYVGAGGHAMTWYELRELASDDLVTLGAHSKSHRDLADPRKAIGPYDKWVQRELTYPKYRLEAETGRPVRTFAWPYGSLNSYALSVAIRAGYEGLLTIYPGGNSEETSPYSLHRYGVYWRTPLSVFARMLEGRPISAEMWQYGLASTADDDFLIP
ncbi:MAG: polysaccharide deacetylase family protein [candidate division Zixibacteria bacterium]|nr:polysaccharide deacetylase family protein [candidate division Zixibacteria bacterium]